MIKIKVCGLTDPLNAREVAETGADFIGYIFYRESRRFVGDSPPADLFMNIPGHVRKTGVFVNETPEKVIEVVDRYGFDMVQLHGGESPEYCRLIRAAGAGVIKAFGVGPEFDFSRLAPYMNACDFFMFDTKSEQHGGSGIRFVWEILGNYGLDKPFFLSGGIGPDDLTKIRRFSHRAFYAADINSRFEISPGLKDTSLVKTFIQEIKTSLS